MIRRPANKQLLIGVVGILVIAMTSLFLLVLASVPPISRDALTHHLFIPKLWLQHGGIFEIPHLDVSYYPMNIDFLYMLPLMFHNDIVPKYIHFAFGLATAWLIFQYLKRRLGLVFGICGALFFLTIPVIVKLSITVYVDLGLVFFSTLSLMSLFKWLEQGYAVKYLIMSGIACGLAMGTKYNGLLVCLLIGLFVPLVYIRSTVSDGLKSQVRALAFTALFVLSALIVFSPWMIKNAIWTGNPIHPLFKSFFQRPNNSNQAQTSPKPAWNHFIARKIVFNEKAWETATTPIRIFFQGRDDNPKYFDGKLNPFLLLLPLAAFWVRRGCHPGVRLEKLLLAGFALLYLLIVYLQTDMRIRYTAPMLPPLVILAMFGLENIIRKTGTISNRLTRRGLGLTIGVMVVGMFFINARYAVHQYHQVAPLAYINGHTQREAYIARHRPEYTVINFANNSIPENARILGVFLGNRGYYSDREIFFDFKILAKSAKQFDDSETIRSRLKRRGITHLIVRYDFFNHWRGQVLATENRQALDAFFSQQTELIFEADGHGLFRCL